MNKLRLKQIIKEELKKVLKETSTPEFASIESALNDFYDSYLAKDLRLSKKITSEERIKRLESFINVLKSYISKLNSGIEEENFWMDKSKNVTESEDTESKKILTYDELFAKYNPENGPAYIEGLEDEPGFKLLPLDKQKYLFKWLRHQQEMDR
jgi:uncharacterized FlgJ-related protein